MVEPACAKKKGGKKSGKKKGKSSGLKLTTPSGGNVIYGSILTPSQNKIKIKLKKKLRNAVRRAGLDDVSVTITRVAESSDETNTTYTVSSDSLDLIGKTLLLNLFPLTDFAGTTFTAGAIKDGDNYQIQITAGEEGGVGVFKYRKPAVVVGTVNDGSGTCAGGTHRVVNVESEALSNTVALDSSTCSYFNEVQADKIETETKSRKILFQTTGEDGESSTVEVEVEEPEIAISEAVTPIGGKVAAVIPVTTDLNGAEFNITPETNLAVESAFDFVLDNAEKEGKIDKQKAAELRDVLSSQISFEDISASDIAEAADALEKLAEEYEDDTEHEGGEHCGPIIQELMKPFLLEAELNKKPDLSKEELLDFGKIILSSINAGELDDCFPKFVYTIAAQVKSDIEIAGFGSKFLEHAIEDIFRNHEEFDAPPEEVCFHVKQGFAPILECKKRSKGMADFCPPIPCLPGDIEDKLRQAPSPECQEIAKLVAMAADNGQCQAGPRACGIEGPPGGFGPPSGGDFGPPGGDPFGGGFGPPGGDPFAGGFGPPPGGDFGPPGGDPFGGGFGPPPGGDFGPPGGDPFGGGFGPIRKAQSFGGDDGCVDFKPPEPPNFCTICETDDDCTGPKGDTTSPRGCTLPSIACVQVEDFEGSTHKVCHLNGKPKNPFTCEEQQFGPDPKFECLGGPPPTDCGIGGGVQFNGDFRKVCCPALVENSGGFGPPGFGPPGFGPPGFGPPGFGPPGFGPPGFGPPGFGPPGFGFRSARILHQEEGSDDSGEQPTEEGSGEQPTEESSGEPPPPPPPPPPEPQPQPEGPSGEIDCSLPEFAGDPKCSGQPPDGFGPPPGGDFGQPPDGFGPPPGGDFGQPPDGFGPPPDGFGPPPGGDFGPPPGGDFGQPPPGGFGGMSGMGGRPGGGRPGPRGGHLPPIEDRIYEILCSDANNFEAGDYGLVRPEAVDAAIQQAEAERDEQFGTGDTDFPDDGSFGGHDDGFGGGFGPPGGDPFGGGFGGASPEDVERCKENPSLPGCDEILGSGGFGPPPDGGFGPPPDGGFGPPPPDGGFGPFDGGDNPSPPPDIGKTPGGPVPIPFPPSGEFVDCNNPQFANDPKCGGGQPPPPPPDGGTQPPPPGDGGQPPPPDGGGQPPPPDGGGQPPPQ